MDKIKDTNKGKLAIGLTQLVIKYLAKESTGKKGPENHFRRKKHIDGTLAT